MADLWADMHQEWLETGSESPTPVSPRRQAEYASQLRAWHTDPAVFMLVGARPTGDAIAYMVAGLQTAAGPFEQTRIGRLLALYVRPSLRGNGLAHRMLEAALGWLRAAGAEAIDAEVLIKNKAGMLFLSEAGFQLHQSVLRLPLKPTT